MSGMGSQQFQQGVSSNPQPVASGTVDFSRPLVTSDGEPVRYISRIDFGSHRNVVEIDGKSFLVDDDGDTADYGYEVINATPAPAPAPSSPVATASSDGRVTIPSTAPKSRVRTKYGTGTVIAVRDNPKAAYLVRLDGYARTKQGNQDFWPLNKNLTFIG